MKRSSGGDTGLRVFFAQIGGGNSFFFPHCQADWPIMKGPRNKKDGSFLSQLSAYLCRSRWPDGL
jgi:hypothetical protein